MKDQQKISPPRWAQQLLSWYCRPDLLEDLQGDLNEYFHRNVKSAGVKKARLIYAIDVLKFCRSYTIRKPGFPNFIQPNMLASYIKISGRSILRNRLFSTINIAGLAISMAVGLLMIGLLSDMYQYDKFHINHDRIYRVVSQYRYLDQEDKSLYASTSLRAAKAIDESVPGIEEMAVLYRGFEGDIKSGQQTIPLSGFWAGGSFFSVFTFPMIAGDPATALAKPYSVVLTVTSAKKLFGNTDPLGKRLIRAGQTSDEEYTVTGVIKDIPVFSHVRFDILASLGTRELTQKGNPNEMSWGNMWNTYVYLLLPEGADPENIQRTLTKVSLKESKAIENTTIKLALQPMSEIALGEDLNNSIGPVMTNSSVRVIGILSVIVILSACFNYTNLSIARSLRRSREVGIRKMVGALKTHVLGQFMVEAIIIALFALTLSFALFVLLKPYFLSLNNQYSEMLLLDLSPRTILYFFLFAILVGILAGLFPALFFSRLNTIQVLKNISPVRGFRSAGIRQGLIVAQFTISLMFIAATITGYKHYKHVLAFDLGFETENMLNIELYDNKADLLKKELSEIPEVKGVSSSSIVTSLGNYFGTTIKYTDPLDSAFVHYSAIDEHYLSLHGHKLLAGRNFSSQNKTTGTDEVIVNEKVLKRFNIGDHRPSNAIGEFITLNGKKMRIAGVVKDFHYGKSIDNEIKEFIFRFSPDGGRYINAKIISMDWPATLSKIQTAWKKIDTVHPLEATFYDDQIEQSYSDFSARIKVIGSLSFLAICIASIGLLGMVVFTTEIRLKEISIRKVLGATEATLVFMLSRGFFTLMGLAVLIALPATHFFFTGYVLEEYAERAPLALSELTVGVVSELGLALLLVCSQTLKVARTNPADVLKNE